MILPNKNIILQYSILGAGANILNELKKAETVSSLWEKSKEKKEIQSFEKFILTLDFLFAVNIIELNDGLIAIKAKLDDKRNKQ